MNFKDKIKDKIDKLTSILEFSDKLKKAMALDDSDIMAAASLNIKWDIRGFTIAARAFSWSKWIPILIAVPQGIELEQAGYINCPVTLPAKWHYLANGTATEILPPKEVRKIILDRVKELSDNKSTSVAEI